MKTHRFYALTLLILLAWGVAACGESDSSADDSSDNDFEHVVTKRLEADLERQAPEAPDADLALLVEGHNEFAVWMYHHIREGSGRGGNIIFSPYSISSAFSLLWPGATGETSGEIASMMSFKLRPDLFHAASNRLLGELESRADYEADEDEGDAPILDIVNDLWGLDGYPYVDEFLEVLALHYGAGMWIVDFRTAWEEARQEINAYIEDQTHGLIQDLLPMGVIDTNTRLVLTNAIYFKGSWTFPFTEGLTEQADFTERAGRVRQVSMMRGGIDTAGYYRGDNFELVELDYVGGDLSMALFVPDEGEYDAFEAALSAELLSGALSSTQRMGGSLGMPRFSLETSVDLVPIFKGAGYTIPFSSGAANFSGLSETAVEESLYVTGALHKAKIIVDEAGTEAAAATAIIVGTDSAPMDSFDVQVDRPFFFALRDKPTGAILFVGSVVEAPEDAN